MTRIFLPRWRDVGDPELDAVVATGPWSPRAAWLPLTGRWTDPVDHRVPAPIRTWLHAQPWRPPQDLAAIERAQQWAADHLVPLSVSLLAGSLPWLFAGAKGAAVLHDTRRLLDDVDRRVNETGRFVLAVVQPLSFRRSGEAVRACQTTRLVHALVRARARASGVAINQQDLAATLLAFSVVSFRGMRRIGVRATAKHADDWWQLWRVVGDHLGIDPAVVPTTFGEASAELDVYVRTEASTSDAGIALTRTLIEATARHIGSTQAATGLVRRLLGDHMADLLRVDIHPPRTLAGRMATQSALRLDTFGPTLSRWLLSTIVRAKLSTPPPAPAVVAD